MTQKLPELGATKIAELEEAWRKHTEAWKRERLMVMKLVGQHELSAAKIGEAVGVT